MCTISLFLVFFFLTEVLKRKTSQSQTSDSCICCCSIGTWPLTPQWIYHPLKKLTYVVFNQNALKTQRDVISFYKMTVCSGIYRWGCFVNESGDFSYSIRSGWGMIRSGWGEGGGGGNEVRGAFIKPPKFLILIGIVIEIEDVTFYEGGYRRKCPK